MPAALTTVSQRIVPLSVSTASNAVVPDLETRDQGLLFHRGAAVHGPLGHGHGQAAGVGLAVGGHEGRADDPLHVQDGAELQRLFGGDHVEVETEAAGGGGPLLQFEDPLLGARQMEAAALLPARRESRLRLQGLVEADAVLQHPGHVPVGAELSHEARRMPGGAAGQFALFQEDHIAPSHLGQVVGDAAAHDASADNDNLCTVAHDSLL